MEEMNALHDFMSKFSHEIEVIWGAAVEKDLGEEVKVTLLARLFDTDVPGIEEQHRAQSKAEGWNGKSRRTSGEREEEEEQRLIDKYYGTLGLKMLSASSYKFEPIILSWMNLTTTRY